MYDIFMENIHLNKRLSLIFLTTLTHLLPLQLGFERFQYISLN